MTTQIRDSLLYEGKTYPLNEIILERYFDAFPMQKPEIEISTSALWRGYIATFEIEDEQLFIKEVEVMADERVNELILKHIITYT